MHAVDQFELSRAIGWWPARRRPVTARAGQLVRSVCAVIAEGSDHPVWRTPDARDRAALLPRRQLDRLLNDGRLRP